MKENKPMKRTRDLYQTLCLAAAVMLAASGIGFAAPETAQQKPNIVFILVDDAGIGDFSCYGCNYGETPNIDRLAKEGMKFTRAYSGNAVCAPSRCTLITGLHPGHALIRANAAGSVDRFQNLPGDQMTVARLLHNAGYVTGGFGKWGLGNPGETGVPENQGFDEFFGYYNQSKAHDYYPKSLIRNSIEVPLNQSGKKTWNDYSATRIADETIKFIEKNQDRPFFCYAAWTPPHSDYVIPDNAPYGQKPWTEIEKNYAAMIKLGDTYVGRVMQKLKDLGLDEKTLVIFSSDNGANKNFIKQLGSTGGYRGYKRLLYEGGIRTPFIVRWPGKIQPGSSSDILTSFIDFLPTAADLAGVAVPKGADGISILPTLLGQEQKTKHESLYFEIYEPFFQQSVRSGDWKGYRVGTKAPLELYDLKTDRWEAHDVAAAHPDVVKKIEAIMAAEHVPSPHYQTPEQGNAQRARKKDNRETPPAPSLKKMLNDEENGQ